MKFIPVSYRNTLLCFILTLVPYETWKSLALQLMWVEHLGMIKRGTSVINFKRSWHEVSPAYLTSYREPGICFLQKNTWELLVTVCYEKIYYNLEVRNWMTWIQLNFVTTLWTHKLQASVSSMQYTANINNYTLQNNTLALYGKKFGSNGYGWTSL